MVTKQDLTSSNPDWWSQLYSPMRQFGERVAEFFAPSAEASTSTDTYEVTMELPGVGEEDIAVQVHDGLLTVSGEKRSDHEEKGKDFFFSERVYGSFKRSFRLPADADADKITAHQKDGVLTISIARTVPKQPEATKIKVNRG